ncbi:hypothetical protein ABRY23_02240 [Melioribacteraceae bacterium 4301-Me]|uniref:hypothetical protein n=1 Tax=Pyranulibacter aquaticus TaxID=3163344 RepID=UPI003595FFBB
MHIKSTLIKKCLLVVIIYFSAFRLFAQDCFSYVSIMSNSDSALIYIDNKVMGIGEVKAKLPIGRHFLQIKENKFLWNSQTFTDTIFIKKCGEEKKLNYKFKKRVLIDSQPQNAEIIKNDKIIAFTPALIEEDTNQLKLTKKNFLQKEININALKQNGNIFYLQRVNEKLNNNNFFESSLFKMLLGTATVFGATAAFFKIKADNKYDNYLQTKDVSIYDDVKRLDLYSGIALSLLQINIGYLVYKFLSN